MSLAIAEKFLTLLQNSDALAASKLLHNDVVWHQPGDTRFSGEHRGKMGVITLLASFAQLGISLELTEVYKCYDDILCRIVIHHEIGQRHEFQLIRLQDGLISTIRHLGDSEYFEQILAAPEAA
ncbi:MAG: nuclear transport factor 2 family protein [Henriciella sp.]|jgi:hypothetical protein